MHPYNVGRMLITACRALGRCTQTASSSYCCAPATTLPGKNVVIFGRSEHRREAAGGDADAEGRGRERDRDHYHTGPKTSRDLTRQADIVVVAIGLAEVLKAAMVRPGAVVVDVGNNPGTRAGTASAPGRRRRLRGCPRSGVHDHAGAGRRRADDGGDAAREHGAAAERYGNGE